MEKYFSGFEGIGQKWWIGMAKGLSNWWWSIGRKL